MSFILDALKKSEESRQQETPAVIGKQVVHLGARKARRWPLWVVLALLPTALLFGWWLGQSPQAPATSPTVQTDSASKTAQATIAVAATAQQQTTRQTTPPQVVTPEPEPEVTVIREQQKNEAAAAPIPVSAPLQARQGPVEQERPRALPEEQSVASASTEEREESALPGYMELPRELRNRMPRLDISLHFYSENPTRRMARINGRLLHEGEEIDAGLAVHEITPKATVIDYQGLLFELVGPRG